MGFVLDKAANGKYNLIFYNDLKGGIEYSESTSALRKIIASKFEVNNINKPIVSPFNSWSSGYCADSNSHFMTKVASRLDVDLSNVENLGKAISQFAKMIMNDNAFDISNATPAELLQFNQALRQESLKDIQEAKVSMYLLQSKLGLEPVKCDLNRCYKDGELGQNLVEAQNKIFSSLLKAKKQDSKGAAAFPSNSVSSAGAQQVIDNSVDNSVNLP